MKVFSPLPCSSVLYLHSPYGICCVQIRLVIEEALNWLPCEDRTVTTPTGKVVHNFYSPKLFLFGVTQYYMGTNFCGFKIFMDFVISYPLKIIAIYVAK